jgi:hypothetical protein
LAVCGKATLNVCEGELGLDALLVGFGFDGSRFLYVANIIRKRSNPLLVNGNERLVVVCAGLPALDGCGLVILSLCSEHVSEASGAGAGGG